MKTQKQNYPRHQQWKLLMSTCATLMIGGCLTDFGDSTNSNTSNTAVAKPLTKGYMLHPSATADTSSRDALDTKNISRTEDIIHAMENSKHKSTQSQRAHTLIELGQSLQTPDTNNKVFYDIIGMGNSPQPLHMDKAATFSGVYVANAHLELRKGANLSASALNLDSGKITIAEGATTTLSCLKVNEGTSVIGGAHLKLVDTPSTELTPLREKRAGKFGWADSTSLIKLGGTIDVLSSAATLVPTSKTASVTTFNASASKLHLSTDTKLTIGTWNETPSSEKPSLHIHWKAPSIEPLLVVKNVSDLTLNKLTIDSLNSSIQVNNTLTVATLPTAANISYTSSKTLQAFGGEFQVNNNPGSLSLTLIKKGSSPDAQAQLSSSAIALSNTVMAQANSEVAGRLFPMDVDTAVTALNTITDSHTWFHDTNLPYFNAVHQPHAAGAWIQGKDLGDTSTTHLGFTTTDGCQLAVTGHVAQQQPLTLAAHAVYSGIALDVISREHQYGASLGWAGRNLFTGLSYSHASLTESTPTPLGVASVDKASHNRSVFYIGAAGHLPQMAAPAIEFSSRLSFDLHRYMSAHALGIDQEIFNMPSRQLTNGLGVDLSLTVPFKTGSLAFNYSGYLIDKKVNQTVALSFEFIEN
jgi:hypothetical protein